jgi:hypothetical protein
MASSSSTLSFHTVFAPASSVLSHGPASVLTLNLASANAPFPAPSYALSYASPFPEPDLICIPSSVSISFTTLLNLFYGNYYS